MFVLYQLFRLCISNDCILFTITIVIYSCFILKDSYSKYKVRRDHKDKNVDTGIRVVKEEVEMLKVYYI